MRPTEMTIKATALGVGLFDILTDRKRFNFRFSESSFGPIYLMTARAEMVDGGMVRIFDIEDVKLWNPDSEPTAP